MTNQTSKSTQKRTRRAPEFFVVSVGYWQGQKWEIEEGSIKTRAEAEAKIKEYESRDWDENFHPPVINYDIKNGRKFAVATKTQVTRWNLEWREDLQVEDFSDYYQSVEDSRH